MDKTWEQTLHNEQDILYRKDRIASTYLDLLNPHETHDSNNIAQQLLSDHPIEKTVVIIPVAAHQEEHTVAHAIAQYAGQISENPFSVVLGLNTYKDSDFQAVSRCIDIATRTIAEYPQLDIRISSFEYTSKPPIGKVRRDLWNGVLRRAIDDGTLSGSNDCIGINHDIDLVSLPTHYIAGVQNQYTHPIRSVGAAYSKVRHAVDHRFPNISRVVSWIDFAYQAQDVGYEAGAVIPLAAFYAKYGGFDPSAITHEVGSFIGSNYRRRLLPTGNLQTSPRRYIDRMGGGSGVSNIWTKDSFGAMDSCRDPETIAKQPDVTQEIAINHIGRLLTANIDGIIYSRGHRTNQIVDKVDPHREHPIEQTAEILTTYFKIRRALASRALTSISGAPQLNTYITAFYGDTRLEEYALSYARMLYSDNIIEHLIPTDEPVVAVRDAQL